MKIFKILISNFLIFISLLLILEGIAYNQTYLTYKTLLESRKKQIGSTDERTYFLIQNFSLKNLPFRPTSYKHSKKKPVVLFGCSYTYGVFLEDNQTFSYKLSNYTNRTVYNRGIAGAGIPLMYYQLNDSSIKKTIPEAEFIIYTFIQDQLPRLFKYRSWPLADDMTVKYKIENNRLIEEKPVSTLFMSTYLSRKIEENYGNYLYKHRQYDKLFYTLMDESLQLAKKNYPGVKFVFLVYDSALVDKRLINKLKNKGFIVIYVSELLNSRTEIKKAKYFTLDKGHPSEKAWDVIIPPLAKRLSM